jgi:hypothetical protein
MTPGAAPVTLDTAGMPDTPGRQGVDMLDHALAEPYWLDDLDLARRHLAREWAPIGCLIEANPITVGGVRGMAQLWKHPVPGQEQGLVYGVSVFLAKTTQTANIMYFMDERLLGMTGIRESVVASKDPAMLQDLLDRKPHPYDPELHGRLPFNRSDAEVWDEQFPGHPLTCVRAWLHDLDRIVTVDPAFAGLPDFRGTTRQANGRLPNGIRAMAEQPAGRPRTAPLQKPGYRQGPPARPVISARLPSTPEPLRECRASSGAMVSHICGA